MRAVNFNKDWYVKNGASNMLDSFLGTPESMGEKVSLPHDAMIHEERIPEAKGGNQTGFYPGGIYTYIKSFGVPNEWKNKTLSFEFEGAYCNASVFINGEFAGEHKYGYTGFTVCADDFINYGEENKLKVICNNSAEMNSRWYSGSGLYRDVNIYVSDRCHFAFEGVRISTPTAEESVAVAEISSLIVNSGVDKRKLRYLAEIFDPKGNKVTEEAFGVTVFAGSETELTRRLTIPKPSLWSCETPSLYTLKLSLSENGEVVDDFEDNFGIRRIDMDAVNGLRMNGKELKLRGTCIHHDNGVIGAATLNAAEERRCRLLKEAGFNCIRSSHNPMSKAMLRACDKLGVVVMDELSDMWHISKNPNDYSLDFEASWQKDIKEIVGKDFNHPSVILYSIGNEIPEVGTDKGTEISRKLVAEFKKLDNSRFVTNALNGLLAASEKLPVIIGDILKQKGMEAPGAEGAGADALNGMMGFMALTAGDEFATHPIMTEKLEECASALDVTGYNYLTARHLSDRELYPNRCILGTETYPADIVRLWGIIKRNPWVIGDMTWTGYDYLGEAGCGIFHYDGTVNFSSHFPDRLSYIGDINILGVRRPVSYLREIVFGLRKDPYIAVERADKYGLEYSITPWMMKDDIASWTWPGYEGKKVKVNVFADADEVELFLNDKSLGRQPAGEENDFTASFEIDYEPGRLAAIAFNGSTESGRCVISTAGEPAALSLDTENRTITENGEKDAAFVTVSLVDKEGKFTPFVKKNIKVSCEGAGYIAGFGSADPQSEFSYDSDTCESFDGRVMAVVRAEGKGKIKLSFSSEGMETVSTELEAK